MVKALLALEHAEVPPHLHLANPTSRVPWRSLRLEVPTATRPWPKRDCPRRAAVSSFGASGTNAHIVLGEAPPTPTPQPTNDRPEVLLLSARTPQALEQLAERYAERLRDPELRLADAAYTTQVGRARLTEGAVIAAATKQEAIEQLRKLPTRTRRRGPRLQRSAWLIPGQGAQYAQMAAGLRDIPAFAQPFDQACEALGIDGRFADVDDTADAQPALFAVSYALGTMLRELGARKPTALLGHSVGEIAAAALAGALTLNDAARLVTARGRLMSALPKGGAMAAIGVAEADLGALPDTVSIAAVNGPRDVVISGPEADVDKVAVRHKRAKRLNVSHAFHSALLEPMLDELRAVARTITTRKPQIPIVSNVTGELWDDTQLDPEYWVRHARGTVRFADGLKRLHAAGARTFVELGPQPVLTPMARRTLDDDAEISWITTLSRSHDDLEALQQVLGRIELEGGRIDWRALHAGRDLRRAELPTYPWERRRYWFVERTTQPVQGPRIAGLGRRVPGALPTFEDEIDSLPDDLHARARTAAKATGRRITATTIHAPARKGVLHTIVHQDRITIHGATPEQRAAGDPWHTHATFALEAQTVDTVPWQDDVLLELAWRDAPPPDLKSARIRLEGDHPALEAALCARGATVVHQDHELVVVIEPEPSLDLDLQLANRVAHGISLAVVTRGAMATPGQKRHHPECATLHGLGRVLALEHPNAWAGAIDLDPDAPDDAEALADAILSLHQEDEQAIRSGKRLVPRVVPRQPPRRSAKTLHRPGTVLVTGGLGGIGARLGRWLAQNGTERVTLTSRGALPDRDQWHALGADHPAASRIQTVLDIEALGAEVEVVAADVTDEPAMTALIERLAADERAPLRGVIHAAGVSDPQFARDLERDRYAAVWEPKVKGAQILDRATRDKDLDLFICFSSVAATWGSQHLASYSASNAYLDALAHARRARGLPALTVAWGPWGLPSGLFDEEVLAFMESVGLKQLAPGQCLDLLGRLQAESATEAMVCAADWTKYRPVMEARRPRPRLAEIDAGETTTGEADAELLAADPQTRETRLIAAVTNEVADVLQLDPTSIDPDGEVFALGLDSLMVMELVGRLRTSLGAEVRPAELFERESVRAWAQYLSALLVGETNETAAPRWDTTEALAADVSLAPDILPRKARTGFSDIFLTGATGFVGAFVLKELLERGLKVTALVRNGGRERIEANAKRYLELPDGDLTVVTGDLAELPGIDADAIVHVGAAVNFAHPYERLKAANVEAVQELLRTGIPLHHVSTYGIWGMPVDGRDIIAEDDDITTAGRLVTGYVQSKWAAEKLVLEAAQRGLPTNLYRLGRVLGDATTGAALTTHFTLRVVKGAIQLGAVPDLDLDVEMTPVDYVAKALTQIAASKPADGSIYHLINRHHMPFATLVDHLRERGWALDTLSPEDWYARLEERLGHEPNELHSVMDTVRALVVGGERAITYDDRCAREALEGTGIACPPLDEHLLGTYLDHLIRTTYLPDPTRGAPPHASPRP